MGVMSVVGAGVSGGRVAVGGSWWASSGCRGGALASGGGGVLTSDGKVSRLLWFQ